MTATGAILSEQFVNTPEECHNDGFVQNYLANRRKYNTGLKSSFTPINGWIDNGGWYPPSGENNLNDYTATYTVPGDPPSDAGQVLFYFIGMQDNAYSAVNILQPVLTWGNGIKGWNLASWDCCPSNITVQSKSITGFGAGDLIDGSINRVNSDTWKINSVIEKTGANTTLTAQVGTYLYDWADVTLEVYGVSECEQFAKGSMTFSKMVLKDSQGATLTPQWSFTGTTQCSGVIKQTGSGTVTITHSNSGF
eukprot:TRINITY_DN7170_c0_g1_i6.p1 TRINITY_DN7170_c0_g1~~TRINITY_DN7170_c0_g1_i6.p1  ORF type:complete len:251 (+),score=30.58 TRINITY_DN7170_c0_g1_i6:117-869(+)